MGQPIRRQLAGSLCKWRPVCLLLLSLLATWPARAADGDQRLLYVATPGVRNYLEFGGHGVLVFDIDNGHKFVRRIATGGLDENGNPINVKGICASAQTGRLYISTIRSLMCLDLLTDQLLWERTYREGCDRMSITPDGSAIYLPSFEKDHWYVIDGATGDEISRIVPKSGAHNTVCGSDGKYMYLAGLKSPVLTIAETTGHTVAKTCGPFSNSIRPFTVNGDQSLAFVCINECLGFEVGDLRTGMKVARVEVAGFSQGPVKRHGCPSHGIGLSPDEKELWVTDGHNSHMHVFDATVMPPKQLASLKVRDEPGWVTFSIDGKYVWPSSGEVIDRATRKTVALLTDEQGRAVASEKMLEIDFRDGRPVRNGDQFGVGRRGTAVTSAVTDSDANGFTVTCRTVVQADVDLVYQTFAAIESWWNPAHTWSGVSSNLSLNLQPGGDFRETLPRGGFVRHLQVVYVAPGEMVRLAGALGPLQEHAVQGSMTVQFAKSGSATEIQVVYRVGGYVPGGLQAWSSPVGQVLKEQFSRLRQQVEGTSNAEPHPTQK